MASCGDVATMEALAATALLRQHFPDLKIRFVNVVDLFRLVPDTEHPHGLSDREFDALFTPDKPVIFNFHAYPWLIHRLTYRRTNHHNIHVRGYKEKGNINTPLELAIRNQIDRFTLAIDAIDRVPACKSRGSHHAQGRCCNQQIDCQNYAYENGIDQAGGRSTGSGRSSGLKSTGCIVEYDPRASDCDRSAQHMDCVKIWIGLAPSQRRAKQKPNSLCRRASWTRLRASTRRRSRLHSTISAPFRFPGEPMRCSSAICCSTT